jgi:LacI family transcriptional regulator
MTVHTPRPTLATVANAAGVSLATVSKVVNGRHDVAPATRARVKALLTEHRYVPVGARRMIGTPIVDLVFHVVDSPWAIEIIRGVIGTDIDVVVSSMSGAPDPDHWAQHVVDAGRSGVIVVTSELTALNRATLDRAGLPVVVIDPVAMPGPELPSVGATNWAGGLAATEHLTHLGHQRIAMISGPESFLCSRARIDGYRAALEQAGVASAPDLVRHGNFHHVGGYEAALDLLQLPNRPTAIFAGSDEQALGTIEAARQLGLSVPGELSVVGFDDLPVARWSSPPLTTVHQPLAQMGLTAARMMDALIAGRPLDHHRVELATQLVIRASTQEVSRR